MSDEPKAQPAVRLVLQYDGEQLRLLSQVPVTMVVPHADPGQTAPGVYVDSRSASDVPLARVRTYRAMAASHEIFPAEASERLRHVERPQRGVFSVVLPAPPEADHVTVVRIAQGAMATDLARFAMDRR
jgi:hypothetical protein